MFAVCKRFFLLLRLLIRSAIGSVFPEDQGISEFIVSAARLESARLNAAGNLIQFLFACSIVRPSSGTFLLSVMSVSD